MKSNIKVNNATHKNIIKIVPKSNDYYNVFFKFSSIPIEMNEEYLKTILHDYKIEDDSTASIY